VRKTVPSANPPSPAGPSACQERRDDEEHGEREPRGSEDRRPVAGGDDARFGRLPRG
jgi:hypothetical protein